MGFAVLYDGDATPGAGVLTGAGAYIRVSLFGDIDGDGDVDVSDLSLFSGGLLGGGTTWGDGDFDGDGDVDVTDLDIFGGYLGTSEADFGAGAGGGAAAFSAAAASVAEDEKSVDTSDLSAKDLSTEAGVEGNLFWDALFEVGLEDFIDDLIAYGTSFDGVDASLLSAYASAADAVVLPVETELIAEVDLSEVTTPLAGEYLLDARRAGIDGGGLGRLLSLGPETASVPEPGTAAVVALAGLCLLSGRYRAAKRPAACAWAAAAFRPLEAA
ncbi:MAG: hypothetical protein AAFX76_13055 [Planctomycetota bacterium]